MALRTMITVSGLLVENVGEVSKNLFKRALWSALKIPDSNFLHRNLKII